jgi:molybdenum cofactor cytidylyltransferase
MICAVIPAGGKSRRMGRPKLALPLGGRTVLEHVIAALRLGGVQTILVVIGPHVAELRPLAEAAGAQTLVLAEETADMRATVEQGLAWLENGFPISAEDYWLLVPGDHPTLSAEVVRLLLEARAAEPDKSIFLPTFQGQRGHPTLIAWKHVARLRAFPAGQGINAYLRRQGGETLLVPVPSPHVLADLDTPEDYERLLRDFPG